MRGILFVLAVGTLAGCAALGKSRTNALEVREAAVRAAMREPASGLGGGFCLGVEGGDPDPALIARLADAAPGLRRASECRNAGSGEGLFTTILRVRNLRWTSADAAEVELTFHDAPHAATTFLYRLKRADGVWSVVDRQVLWTS